MRADAVLAQIHPEAQLQVRLHSVETLLLKFVSHDLRCQPDPPPFLPHIDDHARALIVDLLHRVMQLRTAIAPARPEDIAGQAFAMDAHQHVLAPRDLAFHERQMILAIDLRTIQVQGELAVGRRHLHDLDPLDELLDRTPVLDQRLDGADL